MLAWQAHTHGLASQVLCLDEVPEPAAQPDSLLIEVEAAALNFPDILLCQGTYQERPDFPFTPGLEVVGTLVEVNGHPEWRPGQRVIALTDPPRGGLAERVSVTGSQILRIPDAMPAEHGAALPIAYHTAYSALFRRARLVPGEVVLVHGAAGGVGSAVIQLAKASRATVIATCKGVAHLAFCRQQGADLAVDSTVTDFTSAVRELTEGRGADVVIDMVGGEAFDRSRRCVAFEGRIVVVGFAGGNVPTAPLNHLLLKNYSVLGLHWGLYRMRLPDVVAAEHAALMALYESGAITPAIGAVAPFADAPTAYRQLESGPAPGKIVLRRTP
jgi:NADPH:quinone reductase